MAEYALRLANSVDTAARVRMGHAVGLFPAGALNARGGLRNDNGGTVTTVAGTMQVSVSPLLAWVDGTASDTQSGYPFVLDAAKTITLANGDGANPRIDTIAIVIRDNAFDGSGFTDAQVQVVQGTPAASPVAPTLPANALPLRDVNVPAGLSAGTGGLTAGNLSTDRRTYLAGGVLRVASQTARDALTAVAGMVIYRADTGLIQVYNGTSWDTLVKSTQLPQSGSASVTVASGSRSAFVDITYPTAYAAGVTPHIVATAENSNYNTAVRLITNTTARIDVNHIDGTTTGATMVVHWIALP